MELALSPGTRVTLSELPYHQVLQETVWRDEQNWWEDRLVAADWRLDKNHQSSPSQLQTSPFSLQTSLSLPNEHVPLGARVPTKNPRHWEVDPSLPEPVQAEWAKVSITVIERTGSPIEIELLRPRSWVQRHGLFAGGRLPMNVPELEVDGVGLVTAIEDCPEIASGEGSVVTGRFVTQATNKLARIVVARLTHTVEEIISRNALESVSPEVLVELEQLSQFGLVDLETLEGTDRHPIWSEDRQDWVALGQLQLFETLRAADGPAVVLSVAVLDHLVPVYNIEVHGEHVYQVGEFGLLVHNACPVGAVGDAAASARMFLGEEFKMITNKAGDTIFMSRDGLRKLRFDFRSTSGDLPHVHIEEFLNGRWRDAIPGTHRIYPKP